MKSYRWPLGAEELDSLATWLSNGPSPGVIVLGAAVNGLSYARSLGRRGIPVLSIDARPGPAFHSRYARHIQLPSQPEEQIPGETAMDSLLQGLGERGVVPVVLGSADDWQLYIARRAESGSAEFHSFVAPLSAMETILDKQAQYEAAQVCDIAVSAFANAARVASGEIEWTIYPAILKPRWAHAGRAAIGGKAKFVASGGEMTARLQELAAAARLEDYIVQEVVIGPDSALYGYLACISRTGEHLTHVIKRKLRQYPEQFGDGSLDVTCEDIGIRPLAERLLAHLDYAGLVGVEFKVDSKSGRILLMEINPRTVSTNELPIRAGVDFPWLGYQFAQGIDLPESARPAGGYRVGMRHVNEQREFRGQALRRKRGDTTLFKWLGEMLRADSYAYWNVTDPMPFVAEFFTGAGRRLSRPS